MQNANLDFKSINGRTKSHIRSIVCHLLPGGAVRGQEYIARNPTRADRALGSFKINLQTGRWADFATGDSGGDVISLVAYVRGMGQRDAAKFLQDMIGGDHDTR